MWRIMSMPPSPARAYFPERLAAPQLSLAIDWLENEVEARTFRLADIQWLPTLTDVAQRGMVIRHKERKFGRGCIEAWRAQAGTIRAELDALLERCVQTLRHQPWLLGDAPVYADFLFYGMLGNLTHRGWNTLSPAQTPLAEFQRNACAPSASRSPAKSALRLRTRGANLRVVDRAAAIGGPAEEPTHRASARMSRTTATPRGTCAAFRQNHKAPSAATPSTTMPCERDLRRQFRGG